MEVELHVEVVDGTTQGSQEVIGDILDDSLYGTDSSRHRLFNQINLTGPG